MGLNEQELARSILAKRQEFERGRYYLPNQSLERYLGTMKCVPAGDPRQLIFLLRGPNGIGKSALATCLADYLSQHYPQPWFDGIPYLRDFKRPARGRIMTTLNAAQTTYEDERRKWAIQGRVNPSKEGAAYYRRFKYPNKSEYDVFAFDRDSEQGESVTLSWAIVDEPMSHKHWTALTSRFRFGGPIFLILTPLAGSGWYHDELETEERLNKDVFVTVGKYEDACVEHNPGRGHLPHEYFETIKRNCLNENEVRARLGGEYYELGGRVFQTWSREHHVWNALPTYYQDCYDKGLFTLYNVVDPHPRKAFAIGWYAVFPNEHIVQIAEYPHFNFYRDHSWNFKVRDYAKLIKEIESGLGKPADVRLMDPLYGRQPSEIGDDAGVIEKFADLPDGLALYFASPPNSIDDGHILIKDLLGDPANGIDTRVNFMHYCSNSIFAFGHYGYKEEKDETKGVSTRPELRYKDHVDIFRYPALAGFRYIPPRDPRPPRMAIPKIKGHGGYKTLV